MSTGSACKLMALALSLSGAASGEERGSALGDWGHFLCFTPTAYLNNPEGKPFTITVRVMRQVWAGWNPSEIEVRLTGPDGKALFDGPRSLTNSAVTLTVDKAQRGVYRLDTQKLNVWIESSLPQAVVWTGEQGTKLLDRERGPLNFHANVPRRWWFWVPPDATSFTAEALLDQWCASQREDWGFFIISPRGQRVRALWGQPPHRSHASGKFHQRQRVEVEVEPGAAGRFWCLEVSLGDSHHHSDVNIALAGVPPYLARSPEEWFDPGTGAAPVIPLYDETPFFQHAPIGDVPSFQDLHHRANRPDSGLSAYQQAMHERWPDLEHWSPCPMLGDPDGIELLGDARFALWNPEGRDLLYKIHAYIPRRGMTLEEEPDYANVTVIGAEGKTVFDKRLPVRHPGHGQVHEPDSTIRTGKGVAYFTVTGVERWFNYTYPAAPTVLIGESQGDWRRFRFTACAPRNWYFRVPAGTREFSVRVAAEIDTDVLHVEVCAPDRTMALMYGRQAEQTVTVPEGLDGKIWYIRPSIGSASRLVTDVGPDFRPQSSPMTLDIKGVPGYLAPTWEQWFDPDSPRRPGQGL